MTVSNDKIPTPGLNDTDEPEELILVDLYTQPDDFEMTMTPISHLHTDDNLQIDFGVHEPPHEELLTIKPTRIEQTQTVPFSQNITTNLYADYFSYQAHEEPVAPASDIDSNETTFGDNDSPSVYSTTTIDSSGMTVAVLSQFKSKQEDLNKKQEQRLQDGANALKKVTLTGYFAISVAVLALVAVVFMAIMLTKARTDIEQLQETVVGLKDDLESVTLKISATELSKEMTSAPDSFDEPPAPAPVEAIESEKIAENLPIPVAPVATDILSEATATATTPETTAEKPTIEAKPVASLVSKKPVAQVTAKTSETWLVNIEASKQLALAKAKAAMLTKKGIPVKVVPITIKKVTWYRLQVNNFKNKKVATDYAAKINKAHQLNAVAISASSK